MKPNTIDPRDAEWVRERLGKESGEANTIDPRDEQQALEYLSKEFDKDGICFAFWRGEQMGPFSCWAEADAAIEKAMRDAGVEIGPGVDCGSVVFADPAVYHVPSEEKLNG